jgi:hypothetical protein
MRVRQGKIQLKQFVGPKRSFSAFQVGAHVSTMNKTTLIAMASAFTALMLAPVVSAGVHADFLGTESCDSRTRTCTYSYNCFHYYDLIPSLPIDGSGVGLGSCELNGLPWGACTFTAVTPCISGGDSGTVTDTFCPWTLTAVSDDLLIAGHDETSITPCYP